MSRTETANRLTVSGVTERIDSWSDRMERLQTMERDLDAKVEALNRMQVTSVEDLGRQLMPLAESMASLITETRQTLERVVQQSRQGHAEAVATVRGSTKAATEAASSLTTAMLRVEHQVQELRATATIVAEERKSQTNPWGPAIIAALIPTVCVLWLAWKVGAL